MSEVAQFSTLVSDDYQLKLLSLINEFRQQANLSPFELSTILSGAAQAHAEDMVQNSYFDHVGLDGSSPADRAQRAGYPSGFVGENIAAGNELPEAVFEQWINSPGHRDNMLNENYTEVGVGGVLHAPQTENSHYWVLVLGNPNV
jgi:uncharacterized protein YkwD